MLYLLSLLAACSGGANDTDGDGASADTDTTDPATTADTDSGTNGDTGQTLALGDDCDLERSDCGPDAACCTACCRDDAVPICTALDENGACPLPDIWVDQDRLAGSLDVQYVHFDEDDCAIQEGCVDAPGWRRVLRFDTTTPNTGTAPLAMGMPENQEGTFEWSECHGHYHFVGYADYRMLASDGSVAAQGHKQAFCLEDFERWSPDAGQPRYTCDIQGISVGWADTYDSYLDCQWIDVTDVPAGEYTLEVTVNPDAFFPEISYDNNRTSVTVTLSDEDETPPVTDDCTTESFGETRDCGWVSEGDFTCTPGEAVQLGCDGTCDGTCLDDTVLRVCEGSGNLCHAPDALASNDNASCGSACSMVDFTCPTGGVVTVLVGAWDAAAPDTCDIGWQ